MKVNKVMMATKGKGSKTAAQKAKRTKAMKAMKASKKNATKAMKAMKTSNSNAMKAMKASEKVVPVALLGPWVTVRNKSTEALDYLHALYGTTCRGERDTHRSFAWCVSEELRSVARVATAEIVRILR